MRVMSSAVIEKSPHSKTSTAATTADAASDPLREPLSRALSVVGDRWSLAIVAQMTRGSQRFNDLAESCAPIARTVLSDRLRRLEASGIIERRVYSESPRRSHYRLTVRGAELARVSGLLADWGARHMVGSGALLRHRECGSEIIPGWRCVACGPVPSRDVTVR